jgi:hypothetical protein
MVSKTKIEPATLDELRPYGFRPGAVRRRWCACCGGYFTGAVNAFKCQPCATKQRDEVERICAGRDEK